MQGRDGRQHLKGTWIPGHLFETSLVYSSAILLNLLLIAESRVSCSVNISDSEYRILNGLLVLEEKSVP